MLKKNNQSKLFLTAAKKTKTKYEEIELKCVAEIIICLTTISFKTSLAETWKLRPQAKNTAQFSVLVFFLFLFESFINVMIYLLNSSFHLRPNLYNINLTIFLSSLLILHLLIFVFINVFLFTNLTRFFIIFYRHKKIEQAHFNLLRLGMLHQRNYQNLFYLLFKTLLFQHLNFFLPH